MPGNTRWYFSLLLWNCSSDLCAKHVDFKYFYACTCTAEGNPLNM